MPLQTDSVYDTVYDTVHGMMILRCRSYSKVLFSSNAHSWWTWNSLQSTSCHLSAELVRYTCRHRCKRRTSSRTLFFYCSCFYCAHVKRRSGSNRIIVCRCKWSIGADANSKGSGSMTPLCEASIKGHKEVVQRLLEGAHLDFKWLQCSDALFAMWHFGHTRK